MRNYASAQNIGGRSTQCDATAVRTAPDGTRAYALLDGIGSSSEIRDWTRQTAARLAARAARRGDAETALRSLYDELAADPDRQDIYLRRYMPCAAAVVAVAVPGRPLTVAWAGDSRAYLLRRGIVQRLTNDHNLRRVYPPTATFPDGGNRNVITSFLGSAFTDEETRSRFNHPAIESATEPVVDGDRLVLASDGAYEPHEEAGHDLVVELGYEPLAPAVAGFVDLAVRTARTARPEDEHHFVDNATALVADLTL
ncbi:protein phosphatase 2C domain-containing protein [Streptomyces sp. NPDC019990]|uniref:PP2C family protein-serine/threonine phosphatase n=1 Tax=Streptomyces sp. NPDC019990 TaxID=3154693 RepID=UPI0033C5AC0C